MGREKRIAERRAKEIVDRTVGKRPATESARPAGQVATPGPTAPLAIQLEPTGLGKAIVQILALYLIPIGAVILIGKLLFRL